MSAVSVSEEFNRGCTQVSGPDPDAARKLLVGGPPLTADALIADQTERSATSASLTH